LVRKLKIEAGQGSTARIHKSRIRRPNPHRVWYGGPALALTSSTPQGNHDPYISMKFLILAAIIDIARDCRHLPSRPGKKPSLHPFIVTNMPLLCCLCCVIVVSEDID
jgi:hypothetical protein